ncbi:hypothetical protein GCM10009775_06470 [Microbacterium aoyamense]|uniref:DUF4383 domain-containing protein n=1 Tax=Microbacterium aoyamense TaxID=344166 RepID=A0ABP5AKZ7_9MICO|nr:hypothetical protein [Microbacterium aoyamense]
MTLRRIILLITAAIGLFVGLWAAVWPDTFYTSFPGLGRVWIAVDGPFNEHLIRDVGSLYLALAAASIAATFSRTPDAGRVVGVAWAVFGIPHFIYHASHFAEMAPIDVAGNAVSLGASLLLGIVLMLPGKTQKKEKEL